MALAFLLLLPCLCIAALLWAVQRSPLLKALLVSFDGWADKCRLESQELN
jgi:hypothetical protein